MIRVKLKPRLVVIVATLIAVCATPRQGSLAETDLDDDIHPTLVLTDPIFFTGANYLGKAVMLGVGSYTQADLVANGIGNNSISSIRIFQPGWKIQAFSNGNFTGMPITITVDTPSLAARGFDNQLSSMRITKVSIPKTGLVAYYPFKGNTRDSSGNGFHCTRHNVALTSDRWGQPKNAFRFNGIDSFIECPDSPRLGVQVGADMTVSTWVKPTAFPSEPFTEEGQIISKYRHFEPDRSDFYVSLQLQPPMGRIVKTTAMGFDGVDAAAPRLNRWSNITVVYRGTVGEASVYLNGNLVGIGPLTYNPNASPETLLIGSVHVDPSLVRSKFEGAIDDIRIYERALTELEVRRLARE